MKNDLSILFTAKGGGTVIINGVMVGTAVGDIRSNVENVFSNFKLETNIGDVLFIEYKGRIESVYVTGVKYTNNATGLIYIVTGNMYEGVDAVGDKVYHNYTAMFRNSSFGVSIWKTYEQAEAAFCKSHKHGMKSRSEIYG